MTEQSPSIEAKLNKSQELRQSTNAYKRHSTDVRQNEQQNAITVIENSADPIQRHDTDYDKKSDDSIHAPSCMRKSEGGRFLVNMDFKDQSQVKYDKKTEAQMKHYYLMQKNH